MLCIPAKKRHRTEDSQSSLAAQISKERLVKAHVLVTVSRFMGTNCPSWVQSTAGTPLHLLSWCAVSSLASVCYRKTQGQSLSALPTFGAAKCSVEASGGCRSVLTFRMSSLAEWDIRILSHQAGHLVFMYCLPWLESSL